MAAAAASLAWVTAGDQEQEMKSLEDTMTPNPPQLLSARSDRDEIQKHSLSLLSLSPPPLMLSVTDAVYAEAQCGRGYIMAVGGYVMAVFHVFPHCTAPGSVCEASPGPGSAKSLYLVVLIILEPDQHTMEDSRGGASPRCGHGFT